MVAPEMIKHANQWCHIMVAGCFLDISPCDETSQGSQAYILDDIIDHVKYLQLQLKELSGSRLQAESTAIPLVFHEARLPPLLASDAAVEDGYGLKEVVEEGRGEGFIGDEVDDGLRVEAVVLDALVEDVARRVWKSPALLAALMRERSVCVIVRGG
ncbi:hypothetical protein Ahy_B03g061950 isoform B [Arachis hypogaea]|uniref:Uncharacterized protein n=1 Tax=Arachis hypogaea TaxID=3818 RepID=A0A444ZSN0_ARAHY|nr:hypothetical protein Ahy_B03g061950 isoform B [Arachis hypogaea]